jgi:CRP-like cAMP-binding protein
MGLVTQERRSASVAAESDGELLRLDFGALERIRLRFPYTSAKLFRNVARILAERLRHATGVIVSEARPFTGPEVGAVPPA